MGLSQFHRLISFLLHTMIAIGVFVLSVAAHAAQQAPADPARELHEAARSYYLAVEASENDLDRALTLLHDALDRLERVTGDPSRQAIAGELSAHARSAVLTLDARHRRLADLSRSVSRSLDRKDPQAALDQISRVPPCSPSDPIAFQTTVSATDCRPTSDAHFDLTSQRERAQQDVTAAYALVRQGDSAVRQCADAHGALTAYRQAQDRNGMLALDRRIAAAKSCIPSQWEVTRARH